MSDAVSMAGRPAGSRAGLGLVLAMAGLGLLTFTRAGRELRDTVRRDMQVIRERDPAARSTTEIFLTCYPGFHALWFHRVAHALWVREVPLLPRLDLAGGPVPHRHRDPPGAALGRGLFIDHGAGVVIGETAEIGENVTIYQGVTLGGRARRRASGTPPSATTWSSGRARMLLGSITVGDNVKVGAGSVVVQNVPSNTTVVGNPGRPVIMRRGQGGHPRHRLHPPSRPGGRGHEVPRAPGGAARERAGGAPRHRQRARQQAA